MRTLTRAPRRAPADDRDKGAVMVLVALLLVALVGIGALVIDLGMLYVEKRQLQNGADAAALAVAQDCALGDCGDEFATAQQYANLNAKDNVSAVDLVCGVGPGLSACADPPPAGASGATGWVRVTTSTKTDSGDTVQFVLGPVMDSVSGSTVHASAVAAWGALGKGTILPITFSVCEWIGMGGSVVDGTFPHGVNYIYLHGVGAKNEPGVGHCTPSPSGQDLPGGFGFLANDKCVTTVETGAWVGVEPGNSLPKGCDPATWLNKEVLIAIYDQERGTGNNGQYHIAGFVGFKVLGYKFQGNIKGPSNFSCPIGSNNVVCMRGEFTRFTTDGGGFGGIDYGARVIRMVG